MESIRCIQGQAEGIREQPILIPISEGIPQDILQSFRVQESQEHVQPVRKLDLSHLCFSFNFYFPMFLRLFPSMFSFTNLFSIILFLIC